MILSPSGLLPCPLCKADISLRAGTLNKVGVIYCCSWWKSNFVEIAPQMVNMLKNGR